MGQGGTKKLVDPGNVSTENALSEYYAEKVRPMETRHLFEDFYSPPIDPAEFHAKPTILVLGHYSVGKTSMISYLLGKDYPGSKIGPEPTTDVFVFVQHGTNSDTVPGAALVSDRDFAFHAIAKFGTDFLTKLRGAFVNAELLKHVNFIDTPGILSGEKQRHSRGYDFHKVVKFLAEKVDRIWVLFDTAKMDIWDEYKLVLQCRLAGNDEKVRIILNKADAITSEELVRVRGALMWNLGKILKASEVPAFILGSFIEGPPKQSALGQVFLHDYRALIKDILELQRTCPTRKIKDLVKRARKIKVHALIRDAILRRGPSWPCHGRKGAIAKWTQVQKLRIIYLDLEIRERVESHDFPDPEDFATAAAHSDPKKWARIKSAHLAALTQFQNTDVQAIIAAAKTTEPPVLTDPSITTPHGLAQFPNPPNHTPAESPSFHSPTPNPPNP